MNTTYKKRSGTSGIGGQLYETKLISLILFRLLHDDSVEDFYLACNVDDIGEFDDICLKIKVKGLDRPIRAFIQAKHKDNEDSFLSRDLAKWCKSYTKIRQKMYASTNENEFFCGEYDDADCQFILYTNAKYNIDSMSENESTVVKFLNKLIATGNFTGSRLLYNDKDVHELSQIITNEDIKILARRFANYIHNDSKQSMHIMNDEYILRYHVILADVVDVSEIQSKTKPDSKWRILTFRRDFESKDKYIKMFAEVLYDHVIKGNIKANRGFKLTENIKDSSFLDSTDNEQISLFLTKPSFTTLSPLIETFITYNNNRLEFIYERPSTDINRLKEITITPSEINKAKAMAANKILETLKVIVPITFGNKDLAIRGSKEKVDKRLNFLTEKIVNVCQKFEVIESYKMVTIDDIVEKALLNFNGGLGSAIGNVLVYDNATKLLKFSKSVEQLESKAKCLLLKLESKIKNIQDYRLCINSDRFPKLSFDNTNAAKEFLNKLLIYPKQCNHRDLERLLKKEIGDQMDISTRSILTPDVIFLHYHHEVQKWWMMPKMASYLTKESKTFYQAISSIEVETQMGLLHRTFFLNKAKYLAYTYNESAIETFKYLENISEVNILTDIPTLTAVKIIQSMNNKCVILDLKLVLSLRLEDFSTLVLELKNTEKVPVILCENLVNLDTFDERLKILKQAVNNGTTILIMTEMCSEIILNYFPNNKIYEEYNSLVDFSSETQKEIIESCQVLFQGQKISLSLLIDEVTVNFIEGVVLDTIIAHGSILLGDRLEDEKYDKIKDLYIYRRLNQAPNFDYIYKEYNSSSEDENQNTNIVETFFDVKDDILFLAARSGMGKSTLLTHLSIKTKESHGDIWIVRINLLNYTKKFHTWQENNTDINILETLRFLFTIVLQNNDIHIKVNEINGKVYLDSCAGDEWATFTLSMFLHNYNKSKLIILCDGFDEICPYYKDIVIQFIKVIKASPQEIKLWVTSRPYTEIVYSLKEILGMPYVLEYINKTEQELFINKYISKTVKLMPPGKTSSVIDGLRQESEIDKILQANPSTLNEMEGKIDEDLLKMRRVYDLVVKYSLCHLTFFVFAPRKLIPTINLYLTSTAKVSMGSPLLLNIFAEYYIGGLWDGDIRTQLTKMNLFTIYTKLVDKKMTKLFEEKYGIDIYNPYIRLKYEKDMAKCLALYKKLAAHELFGSPIFSKLIYLDELKDMSPFTEKITEEYDVVIEKLKKYSEVTGFISTITVDKRPVFVHRTLLEYFAVEFIIDILKSEKFDTESKRLLLTVIAKHCLDIILTIIPRMLRDDRLVTILDELSDPFLLFPYHLKLNCDNTNNLSYEQYVRMLSSSEHDYETMDSPGHLSEYNTIHPNESIVDKMKPHLRQYFV